MVGLAAVKEWLFTESDPSIRLRYLRELEDARPGSSELESAREALLKDGWAARILELQLPEGQWTVPRTTQRDLYVPKYIATNWRLLVLSDLGLTRATPAVDRAVRLFMARDEGPDGGLGGKDSEVCYTGNSARMFLRFGYADDPHVAPCIDWLCQAQKSDGGWHCFPSETGTLDCWEALAAFAVIPPEARSAEVRKAVERGADFYLDRELLREGDVDYPPWRRFHYPVHYYYDVLVGLDTLTALGYGRDPRLKSALDLLESRRNADGSWNMDAVHPDYPADGSGNYRIRAPYYPFVLEPAGFPSRWVTVTALSVLRRAGRV